MFVTRLIGRVVAVMVALGYLAPVPLRANPADILLLNGRIAKLDDTSSVTEALAITGDRIIATGSSHHMRKLAGAATTIVDLGGRTVIPGLIDSHIHRTRRDPVSSACQRSATGCCRWRLSSSCEKCMVRPRSQPERLPE